MKREVTAIISWNGNYTQIWADDLFKLEPLWCQSHWRTNWHSPQQRTHPSMNQYAQGRWRSTGNTQTSPALGVGVYMWLLEKAAYFRETMGRARNHSRCCWLYLNRICITCANDGWLVGWLVGWLICVCQQDYVKTDMHKTQWIDGTWAKKELIKNLLNFDMDSVRGGCRGGFQDFSHFLRHCEIVLFVTFLRDSLIGPMPICLQFGAAWLNLRGLLGLGGLFELLFLFRVIYVSPIWWWENILRCTIMVKRIVLQSEAQ